MITLDNFREKMIEKAKKEGLSENFGQEELKKLKNECDYNPWGNTLEAQQVAEAIDDLDEWLMNLDQDSIILK